MAKSDDKPPPKPNPKRKPRRLDEARRIIEEYADDLQELIRKLRQKLH
jgi:hypothetical protein